MWAHLIIALVGAWIMTAPAALKYEGSALAVSDRVVGPLIVTFGVICIWECTRGMRWLNTALGCWLIAAPWTLPATADAAISAVASGVIVAGLSLVRGRRRHSFGGGWLSLWRPQVLFNPPPAHPNGDQP